MRLGSPYQLGIFGNMSRCCTATTTQDIHQPFIDKGFYMNGHLFRRLVIRAEAVWQTGIRISTYIIRSIFCQFSQVWFHVGSAERAVHTENIGMLHGSQKRKQCLSGKRTSTLGRQRQRKHNRQIQVLFLQYGLGGF